VANAFLFLVTAAQTLSLFLKTLSQKRASEKSLWVKKFIKDIVYSRDFVQINFFSEAPAEKEKPAEMAGFSVRNMKNGSAFPMSSNYIAIILPNTIHHCKKKNING
jgi:hypothetical protein